MKTPIRLILADDHAVVRTGIRAILEQADDIQIVAEAQDGKQACQLIEAHQPDLIVLDIQMPQLTGIDVTRWVREHYPEMGVLILSAFDDEPYIVAVLQAGANGYVLKNASPQEVIQAVHNVYAGKSTIDPHVAAKLMQHIASQTAAPAYEPLSDRELEVLVLVGKGLTNKEIGAKLKISDRTVQGHLANIFSKMQANSRTKAVMRAVSFGLIDIDIIE